MHSSFSGSLHQLSHPVHLDTALYYVYVATHCMLHIACYRLHADPLSPHFPTSVHARLEPLHHVLVNGLQLIQHVIHLPGGKGEGARKVGKRGNYVTSSQRSCSNKLPRRINLGYNRDASTRGIPCCDNIRHTHVHKEPWQSVP